MNDNDVRLVFSIAEELTKPEEATEQVAVMMTHRTAKLLMNLLKSALEHLEKTTGKIVEFDEEKFKKITAKALVGPTPDSIADVQP